MGVSVIIPTLNEESCLGETVAALKRQQPLEIIVADGGSSDGTRGWAAGADWFLTAPGGRAAQMNAGAAVAAGEILLFLHADCVPEEGALAEAERLLRRPNVAAGCFRMCVRAEGTLYRLIDAAATARVRLTGLVYGDQGLFVRRDVFQRIGGFPALRLMEDLFISRTLRRLGRIMVSPRRIFVSPRRWQRSGLVRQTLRNWALTAAAAGGVHPDRLARFYPLVRSDERAEPIERILTSGNSRVLPHHPWANAMLLYEKANQVTPLLAETGLDCWLIFVRETDLHPDPGFELVVGSGVVRNSAFLFGARGERIAIAARFDTTNLERTGVFSEVIGYDEDIRNPLRDALHRLDPRTIGLNYSPDNVTADGLTHGQWLLLNDLLRDTPYAGRLTSAAPLLSPCAAANRRRRSHASGPPSRSRRRSWHSSRRRSARG